MSVGSTHHLEMVFVWKQNYILVDEYFFFCCTWIVNSADKKLYLLSNEILKTLNSFLTKHQNNYRRWHKYVSDNDKVTTKDRDPNGEFISLPYHLTPISTIQKHYYHFSQVLEGFKEVNDFFNDKVVKEFDINVDKWSE